jgi:Cell division protein CrgA
MPKSKSKRSRYQPPPRKKPKPSPRWYGWIILALLFGGAAIIVFNYLNLLPGPAAENVYLFVGLGLIALGFLGATQWR